MNQLLDLIAAFDPDRPTFPPTEIYNEGWLLRIILNWFSGRLLNDDYPLSFREGSVWFSEALIPSPFHPRYRGDPLGESRTHADAVIGQIEVGRSGKADLALRANASQFVVLEAKISSPLSSRTTNAPNYDQAARNVACMAEVLRRFRRPPQDVAALGFYVLAPQEKIRTGIFDVFLDRDSLQTKVEQRAAAYEGDRDMWYRDWVVPVMENIRIGSLSWEEILARIGDEDPQAAASIRGFYAHCLDFN